MKNQLFAAALSDAQSVEKASLRQLLNHARQIPSALRLRGAGLRYGQRVTVNDDPDKRKVGRALDFRRVKTDGPYRRHPSIADARVEVSAGKGQSLYAPRKLVRPARS